LTLFGTRLRVLGDYGFLAFEMRFKNREFLNTAKGKRKKVSKTDNLPEDEIHSWCYSFKPLRH
jgi:hypothetical protein